LLAFTENHRLLHRLYVATHGDHIHDYINSLCQFNRHEC